jgi:hypothetical protein
MFTWKTLLNLPWKAPIRRLKKPLKMFMLERKHEA